MSENENSYNTFAIYFDEEAKNIDRDNFINTSEARDGTIPRSNNPSDAMAPIEVNEFNRINLFYAYAYEDEVLQKSLKSHLAVMRRQGLFREWEPRNVRAGLPLAWITGLVERSQIILLLISPDFLASDTLYNQQVEPALRMQGGGHAQVVVILLRPTGSLQDSPLGKFLILPRNKVPVSEWRSRDKAFEEIAEEIRKVVDLFK